MLLFLFCINHSPVFAQASFAVIAREMAIIEAFREANMLMAMQHTEEIRFEESLSSFILQRLHPYASLTVDYDDNIYLTDTDQKGYIINKLRPGIKFILGTEKPVEKKSRIELDLGTEAKYYVSKPSLSAILFPYASFSSSIEGARHKLIFNYSFNRIEQAKSKINSGQEGFVDYSQTNADLGWEVMYNRLGFALDYKMVYYLYGGQFEAGSTYRDQTVGIEGFFRPISLPKTRFLLEYDLGKVKYTKASSNDSDSDYSRVWIGARDQFTKKTSGLVKFGYEKRDYKDGAHANLDTIKIDLNYQYSPKTEFLLKIKRANMQSPNRTNGTSETNTFSLSSRTLLRPRLTLKLGLEYSDSKYKDSNRKDKVFGCSGKLEYALHEWLTMYLGYQYAEDDSNLSINSYKNNVYSLGMGVTF